MAAHRWWADLTFLSRYEQKATDRLYAIWTHLETLGFPQDVLPASHARCGQTEQRGRIHGRGRTSRRRWADRPDYFPQLVGVQFLAGIGHFVPIEAPDAFIEVIRTVL